MLGESWQMLLTFALLATVFLIFVKEWLAPELAALAGTTVLLVSGILGEDDLKGVFGNPAPLTIGAMFILSAALTRTGAIDWLAAHFTRWAGKSLSRTLVVLAVIVMPLSAFLNNTPVVIVFLPVLIAFSRSSGIKASKLLIPLSFLSILGGTITLIGTSTNLLVAGVAREYGQQAFGIFEISTLGLIYSVIGFLYLFLVGRHQLPSRDTVASLLDVEDARKFCSALEIADGSPMAGQRLTEVPLFSSRNRIIVYEVMRQGRRVDDIPLDALVLNEGDILWFHATSKQLAVIREAKGLTLLHEKATASGEPGGPAVTTVEAIIGRRSSLVGRSIRESNIRRRYGVMVAAVHRKGVNLREGYQDIRLAFGDTLLVEGPVHNLSRLAQEEEFLSLSEVVLTAPRTRKIFIAAGILSTVVVAAATNLMPISAAALAGAVAVILCGCINLREAYRSIEWSIIFLIYGMLAIGLAMDKTGGAKIIANAVVDVLYPYGPYVVLSAIYLLASILTELVTNNAVAILLTPIVISIAASMGVDPRGFIVAIMFGASASFITPIGYQTNTYVYGAGGYRFSDFPKVGVPLNLILWGAATWLIPKLWPF